MHTSCSFAAITSMYVLHPTYTAHIMPRLLPVLFLSQMHIAPRPVSVALRQFMPRLHSGSSCPMICRPIIREALCLVECFLNA